MLSRFVALSVSLTLEVSPLQFTTGDDNIAGHANDTLVEDSYFGSGHGASIGSLCDSYIRNFTVRNSVSLSLQFCLLGPSSQRAATGAQL